MPVEDPKGLRMAHNPKVVGSNPTLAINWGEKMKVKINWFWGLLGFLGFLGLVSDPYMYAFFAFFLFFLEPVVRKAKT